MAEWYMADVMEVEDANAAVRARIAAGEKREDGEELQEATYTQLLMGITKASPVSYTHLKEYRDMREKYEDDFRAGMDAEAVKELLQQLDLEQLSEQLHAALKTTSGPVSYTHLFKSPRPAAATLPVSAFLPFSLAMGHGRFPAPADGSFQVLGQL